MGRFGTRKAPGDIDKPPEAPVVVFNHTQKPFPKNFGPSSITKALKAGYYVLARIPEAPTEVSVHGARRDVCGAVEVLVSEGWRLPYALRTVDPKNMKGVKI